MDKETTFRKTAAGLAAIANRHQGLTPRERALLILIDGKHTAGELTTLGGANGHTEQILQTLLAQGFIEAGPQARGAATEPTGPAMPLAQARGLAVRRLTDLLGPGADEICMRLEAVRSPHEFRALVRRVGATLRNVVGAQRAEQFVTELENIRTT